MDNRTHETGLAEAGKVEKRSPRSNADGDAGSGRLAPLVETTFSAAHIMVTEAHTDMFGEGRGEELEELAADARA